ncbi:hypothetical protein [Planctobacterium marinum]|uniref:DUF3828 domain-containing protein n=1 Tax=Planctobacterium marinum TaxID=1631968 RepID=A0AA48KU88_9ALTE|nr:hypothetical protein MACH26_38500 [Planctobacterium marinum]
MKLRFLFTLLFLSFSTLADGFKSEQEAKEFTDKMMEQFVNKKFQQGLNEAKKYWPLPDVEIDGLANQIAQQWPIVDQRFGQAIDSEFVSEKRIGESFLRYYYLHKFENHAIYWQIDFYKPRDEWKINSILFLDTLETLYE